MEEPVSPELNGCMLSPRPPWLPEPIHIVLTFPLQMCQLNTVWMITLVGKMARTRASGLDSVYPVLTTGQVALLSGLSVPVCKVGI